ncbi:MAG TPA: PDZ domain-containing protein [Ferruginibacter sp.]|nr:PDZ domain-containing protein [Ferruginibacter sp.]
MKRIIFTAALLGLTALTTTVVAQEDKGDKGEKGDKDKKESQEIIIRKKGDKDTKITVEIKGDKVTINGKPLSEFKDDEITVNKRNVTIWNGNRFRNATIAGEPFSFNWNDDNHGAFLGVTTEDAEGGAKITDVTKESAADKAGLKVGDIITKVGEKKVDDPGSLYEAVSSMKPKEDVKVLYKRDGKENSVKATLGERKGADAMAYSFSGPDGLTRSYTVPRAVPRVKGVPRIEKWNDDGMADMAPSIYTPGSGSFNLYNDLMFSRHKLGLKIQDTEDGNGVKVLDVDKDSPAEKAGLKKDDVVTEIAGKKVANTDDAREQLHDTQDKAAYNIKAKRNSSEMSFDIKIPKKLKTANL